uniref:Endonuclease/exonuclease/phosphatase domain-containing protein n=1 Tax=Anolis carolinensis TaxID=28377 RepID=A0A803T9E3_ANOCA
MSYTVQGHPRWEGNGREVRPGTIPGEGNGNPPQYSCHENYIDQYNQRNVGIPSEDRPPRSEDGQNATGEEQGTSPSSPRCVDAVSSKPEGKLMADDAGGEGRIRCSKNQHTIGIWNVRSMSQGKLDVVIGEMPRLKIDILGVSELKWTGMGHFTKDDHQIYYCGQEEHRRNEVAFIINNKVAKAVIGYNPKNDRMISIRVQGKPFNITVIQIYAPTTAAEEAELGKFYEDMQHLVDNTPKRDIILITGDWNAKVGSQMITGITGKHGLGQQNEVRRRQIEFCQENSMCITNTLFQQPKRWLYTWTSPDGQHRNQIDYILCSQRWRTSIQSVKTRRGADCSSDHKLLITKFRIRLKRMGKIHRPIRYDLTNIPSEYAVEVKNRFQGLDLINRVPEELWTEVHNIVQEVATKYIPKKKKTKKARWLSVETLEVAQERRKAKGNSNRGRYAQLNAQFQRLARRDKELQ